MGVERIIVLSLLVTQALSAPSGCIESCTSYHRTYQTQTSGGYQDHAGLTQAATNLDHLAYARPGNWTEHNHYRTDGGHGNVHEERGQYVEGPKRVRYYKKNYTASYSTGNVNGAGLLETDQLTGDRFGSVYVPTTQQLVGTHRTYNQIGGVETTAERQEYNRIHSQQHVESQSTRRTGQSERLEDFGEYSGNSQVAQHAVSGYDSQGTQDQHRSTDTQPTNWSRVDSYRTDGGHGRVFEEEGQYTTGPKKVRYYKRNYTSSYRTGGIPTSEVVAGGTQDIHREIEKLHREIGREIHHLTAAAQRESDVLQTNVDTLGLATGNLQTAEGHDYRHQTGLGSISQSSLHHNEEQIATTSNGHVQQVPYISPSQRIYSAESHNSYERREGYVPGTQTAPHYVSPTSGYSQVITDRNTGYGALSRESEQRAFNELRQAEVLGTHRSSSIDDHVGSGNLRQSVYNQHLSTLPTVPGQASHYREHWSSSSRTRESSYPQISTDAVHVDQESARYNSQHYTDRQNIHNLQAHSIYQDQSRQNFNSAYRTSSGKLLTGTVDLGQIGETVDCAHGAAEQIQHGPHYHRNYKRSAKYDEQDDMQQHQTEQQTDDWAANADLVQQTSGDDFLQPIGKLELGQERQDPEFHDLTQQQTMGRLEFGQHAGHPHQSNKPKNDQSLDDLTQQTTGQLELGQDVTQQTEDLTQQTGGFDDFTERQKPHHLEKPLPPRPYLEDFTQQNEDLTQQTGGFDDFIERQKPHHLEKPLPPRPYLEDFTQGQHRVPETFGKLELGSQSHPLQKPAAGNQHLEDLTQQNEDLTQQTSGFNDFDRTHGRLEFGQQPQKPWGPHSSSPNFDLTQSEDLTQKSSGLDDFTQTHGNIEFGQHSRYPQQSRRPVGDQHLEDMTQNTRRDNDLTQQTTGKLELGQQSHQTHRPVGQSTGNQHLEDLTQQNEDLTQQTGGFDDFTQHATGNLEFGQQTQYPYQPWKLTTSNRPREDLTHQDEDLTQQTGGFNDFTQQTSGKLEFGQQTQKHFRPWEQQNEDLTQQTTGNLEFGQYQGKPSRPIGFNGNSHNTEDVPAGDNDFLQHTGGFSTGSFHQFGAQDNEELTQQTTNDKYGDLFQQSDRHRWNWQEPANLEKEDLTQQFEPVHSDYKQQSAPLEFGSQSTEEPSKVIPLDQVNDKNNPSQPIAPKPAQKPKPKPRYSRPAVILSNDNTEQERNQRHPHWSDSRQMNGQESSGGDSGDVPLAGIYPSPPEVDPEVDTDDIRSENLRGDQDSRSATGKDNKELNKQTRVSAFDIERGNVDQVNWLHKSNDATVGLQWHYTYHPSDLTNSEPVQNSYYPSLNYNSGAQQRETIGQIEQQSNQEKNNDYLQQGSKPFNTDQLETQDKSTPDTIHHQSSYGQSSYSQHNRFDSQYHNLNQGTDSYSPSQNYGYGLSQSNQGTIDKHITMGQLEYGQEKREEGVKGGRRRQYPQSPAPEHRLEPRILEAYGGGPYDGSHTDDIYSRVTINPSATLPPINAEDPWDIREKPKESITTTTEVETTPVPTEVPEITSEMAPPSFWGRLGNKITSTFDKAKEKARGIFG